MKKKSKAVRYNKWGYIFLLPFIIVYVIFQLIPMVTTIYNSFFENYLSGLTQIGPNFVGLANYKKLFSDGDIWVYAKNTMVMWIMCFIPQIFLSLLLGAWFSDVSLKLKGQRFFKTVMHLHLPCCSSHCFPTAVLSTHCLCRLALSIHLTNSFPMLEAQEDWLHS